MHIANACVRTSPISFVTFPRPACNKGNHGRRHAGYVRMRRALRSRGNNVLIPLTSLLLHECVENFVGVTILNLKSVEKSLALWVVYSSASGSDLENLIVTRFATCTSPINYFIYPPAKPLFFISPGYCSRPKRNSKQYAYGKVWGTNEVHPGRCASDELSEWELKMEEMVVLMTRLK